MMTNGMIQAFAAHSRCYKDYPGGEQQRLLEQAAEECGELVTALAKYFRAVGYQDCSLDMFRARIVEEYADVFICLEALLSFWKENELRTGSVDKTTMINLKVERLSLRLEAMEAERRRLHAAEGIEVDG